MLYILKESNQNLVIFHRTDDSVEQVLEWLAESNPRKMTHLMTVDDVNGSRYTELKTDFKDDNIHSDWYSVKPTPGWERMFNRFIAFSSYINYDAINPMFQKP